MSRRNNFTNATKDLAWGRACGRCEKCGTTIGPFNYDHIIPCELGGDASLDNCQLLCKTCHGFKSQKADVPAIAKAKRLARTHHGIKKPRTILGGQNFRASRYVTLANDDQEEPMLYDPKWEVKADPYSLANLIVWLEKQPQTVQYHVFHPSGCLLGQFASAMGSHEPWKVSIALTANESFCEIALKQPWTYGAALKRARSVTR